MPIVRKPNRLSPPVVGVCGVNEPAQWGFWDQSAVLVAESYLASVRDAGAIPIILAPQEVEEGIVAALLDRVDALLLAGGSDIDPSRYGQDRMPVTEHPNWVRDGFELALVTTAMQRDIPVLGICRGLQIINVATGGTLHQDLTSVGYAEHRPHCGQLDSSTHHFARATAGSAVGDAIGEASREVNSHHHQGIDLVGNGGWVTACSEPDGIAEAVEWPDFSFVVGVQWHPEVGERDSLFAALVAAAERPSGGDRRIERGMEVEA